MLKESYLKIPVDLISNHSVEETAVYTYFVSFCSKKGFSYPSIFHAAKNLRFAPNSLSRAIDNLIKNHYLNSSVINKKQCYWPSDKVHKCIRIFRETFQNLIKYSGYHLGLYILLKKLEIKGEIKQFTELRDSCRIGIPRVLEILKTLEKEGFIKKIKTQTTNIYKTNEKGGTKTIEEVINKEIIINTIIQTLSEYNLEKIEGDIIVNVPIKLQKEDVRKLKEFHVVSTE